MMRVTFFHRKPRPGINFSVEGLFQDIRSALPPDIQYEVREVRFHSNGFFKRLYIALEVAFAQRGINQLTGDINFAAIFLRKSRTILTILDVGFMQHPSRLARYLLRLFWIVLPVRRSAVITTISASAREELLKYVRVDPDRVRVIYVPIKSHFVKVPGTFRKERPRLLQIGTKPNKNVARLIRALDGIPCDLVLVGGLSEELSALLKKHRISYEHKMNLTPEEILQCYVTCDVLCFASVYEGFGMPIVEANAVGRVVVTSNLLSMPEVAGGAACLVDPFDVQSIRDGILRVIMDDEYRNSLINQGFVNCKRFEAQQIAEQYAGLYREIMNR